MSEQIHNVLTSYLHGELSDGETARLQSRLANEPELIEQLMEVACEEATLRSWAKASASSHELDEVLVGQPAFHKMPKLRFSLRRRVWAVGVTVALSAVIVTIIGVILHSEVASVTGHSIATVDEFRGNVHIHRERAVIVVSAPGQELYTDDRVETIDGLSAATVALTDGTQLVLAGNASLELQREKTGQSQILVQQGSVAARVSRQEAQRPLLLTTANARLEVLGTSFLLDAGQDATELSVTEGRVRLTRLSDGASVEVAAGQHVRAAATDEPLTASVAVRAGDLFEEDFEGGLPAQWSRGRFTQKDLPAGARGAVAAQEVRQRDGVYFHIGTPKAWNRGLFESYPDSHLHFTYRLSKPDWFQIFLSARSNDTGQLTTATYRFKDERLWWPMEPNQWRTATVPLSSFGRVSDWSEEPPGTDELPFEILFTSKDNNLSLVIDRMWVTRGGPGALKITEAE